jgi:hypothetical protein
MWFIDDTFQYHWQFSDGCVQLNKGKVDRTSAAIERLEDFELYSLWNLTLKNLKFGNWLWI